MYSIENFEEYTLRKSLGKEPVLAWSRKNGYHFLSLIDRAKAMANGETFKIVAVQKED